MIDNWWLGAVQPVSAMAPDQAWIWVTGEPIDGSLWATPVEPNDGNGIEDDHAEQFAVIVRTAADRLVDVQGGVGRQALCECDGRPISMEAQTAIDQARNL